MTKKGEGDTFCTPGWFNQQTANVLKDVKQPPRETDPYPIRTVCRVIFVTLLLTGFLLLLVYYYVQSPDVSVEQVLHLQPGEKNYDFPIRELYNLSAESNMTWRNPIICPCSTISVKWRDIVSFYILHSNSTAWNVSLYPGVPPRIDVPYLYGSNISLLSDHVVKGASPVTAQRFCNVSTMWPIPDANTSSEIDVIKGDQCLWLAASVFPGAESLEDTTRSSQILETPTLLNREIFNMRVAALAKDSVVKRRDKIDSSNQNSATLRQYYNGMSDLMTGLLDRDLYEFVEWESYYSGAIDLQSSLATHVGFGWANPMVFMTRDAEGLIFLHPQVDWMAYYEACAPKYCEETKPMSKFQQAYRAFGLLGGVQSIVMFVVGTLLWPATASLLKAFCKPSGNPPP